MESVCKEREAPYRSHGRYFNTREDRMIGGINYASSQIASVYNNGSQQLADTLTKIASGKKFQSAAEDLIGFIRSQNLQVDIDGYGQVRENLTEFKAYTSASVTAASSIYESLTEMKNLASQYAGTSDTDMQAEYASEFNALRSQVETGLENTYVDGTLVTASGSEIKAVDLDPDGNGSLSMNYTDVASNTDVAALDITDTTNAQTDVQTEIDSMLTYLSEAKAYDAIADQQLNLTNTIINSKQAVKSLITDIDEAEETNNALDQSIRQQAAMSMLAQANMSRQAVMKLYM